MTLPHWAVRLSRSLEVVNAVARALYRYRVLRARNAQVPVVSVGNIAMGGTGKTPLVAALGHELLARGQRPAVLSRGYRRSGGSPVLVTGPTATWEEIGDEPALLARAVPGLAIVIDADRVAGAERAVEEHRASHLLLDDGFQHWRLARDLDVVVVDGRDPLCRWRPRREHPRSIAHADAVVVVGSSEDDDAGLAQLRRFARSAALLRVELVPHRVHRGREVEPPNGLAGARVLAAAGIAEPWRFEATLADLGAEVVGSVNRPDHHAWRQEEVEALLHAAGAQNATVVMTAKDAVKVPIGLLDHLAWLEVRLEPVGGSFAELLAPVLDAAHTTT